MERCYLGESFEIPFKVNKGTVTSASFKVIAPDGTIQDQGLMGVDGQRISFRFTPEVKGIHTIEVTWTTGQDIWKNPFLIEVR